jgi:hypothetical protein
VTPTPCMVDMYHGDSLPYATYAGDAIGFALMVAGGWPFLIHKASQGSLDTDTKVVGRLAAAAGVPGMNIGIYHFMDDSPIHTQIGRFMGVYAQVSSSVPKGTFIRLAIDNEPSTLGLAVTAQTDQRAAMMAQAMYMANGKLPLVYGDASQFFSATSSGFLTSCPRWLAKYGPWATNTQWGHGWSAGQWQQFSDGTTNTTPTLRFNRNVMFSLSHISVPGFTGTPLDMSAFSGSLAEAIQTWGM